MEKAVLVLEDGKYFYGKSFGSGFEGTGEVVFNTGMTGYQEILTDPSYTGQIVVMTYPLIGNYGINEDDVESCKVRVKGLVVKEYSPISGSWKHTDTLDSYLKKNDIPGICGLDTRALTKYIRNKGAMMGVISNQIDQLDMLVKKAKATSYEEIAAPFEAGTAKPYHIPGKGYKVAVLDFGIKENILRYLSNMGCDVYVLPGMSSLQDIMSTGCDGVLLSNGPGNPENFSAILPTVQTLMQTKPVFGICLGHQILGLALGGHTYKLLFGHRGANHPVKDLRNNRVYITSQNHGYAIDSNSLGKAEVDVTHININDQTIEGIKHKYLPVFSVQYHPEAAPGPQDSRYLFEQFLQSMDYSMSA